MSHTMEKILLTLFLILGLNVFTVTHAQDEMSDSQDQRDERVDQCPIKGQVSMRVEGTIRNGEVLGWIDNKYVSWPFTMGNIQGYYNSNFMNLRVEEINYNEYSMTGWIGSYFVRWRTFGGYFNERIDCR